MLIGRERAALVEFAYDRKWRDRHVNGVVVSDYILLTLITLGLD